jgi:hypothetical protein
LRTQCYDGAIERILCRLCETRKPRRYCPGVGGDICSICCGTEREQSVHCPLDCPFLQEARKHEAPPIANLDDFPNNDIKVTEQFLREHESLLIWCAMSLLQTALQTPNAVDNDIKAALDALVRTYRTMQTGLYYQTRPDNMVAVAVMDGLQAGVEELRKRVQESSGMHNIRDVELLGVFAFLQRLEIQHNNGRRLGRAFIDWLGDNFEAPPDAKPEKQEPSLLL